MRNNIEKADTILNNSTKALSVSSDLFYSEQNFEALRESISQLKNGKTVIKTFAELDNFIFME